MKKLLSPTIIAALAIAPTFADNEPTLIPTPASCNNNVLNTTSGSASLEAIYTPNTITTQWYTGYGENTAVANATTCIYDGTINFPQTNPSRPGYAFNGWKLRTPTNPLLSLDTSINGTNSGYVSNDGLEVSNSNDYNLTENGSWAVTFSYGTINGTANCIPERPVGFTTVASLMGTLGEQFSQGEITQEQYMAQINSALAQYVYSSNGGGMQTDLNNLVPNTTDTTTNPELDYQECWCRVTGYTPTNGSLQNINSSKWVYMPLGGDLQCASSCVSYCTMFVSSSPFTIVRPALYGQIN